MNCKEWTKICLQRKQLFFEWTVLKPAVLGVKGRNNALHSNSLAGPSWRRCVRGSFHWFHFSGRSIMATLAFSGVSCHTAWAYKQNKALLFCSTLQWGPQTQSSWGATVQEACLSPSMSLNTLDQCPALPHTLLDSRGPVISVQEVEGNVFCFLLNWYTVLKYFTLACVWVCMYVCVQSCTYPDTHVEVCFPLPSWVLEIQPEWQVLYTILQTTFKVTFSSLQN